MSSAFPESSDSLAPRSLLSVRVSRRLGLEPPTPWRRVVKALLLVLLTWLPLVLFSVYRGHVLGEGVAIPLFHDPAIHSRFLFVVPLLEIAQIVVEASLLVQMRHFLTSGLVPATDHERFAGMRDQARRLRSSFWIELGIASLAIVTAIGGRVFIRHGVHDSTWERLGTSITPAGWWYILVSLPILYYFLLNALWIFLVWAWFIIRASRLDLDLAPTHPDRAGGLGFLGWSMASFAIILLAVSALISGGLARRMLHHGDSLNDLKYQIFVFTGLAIAILHLPLFSFTGRLARSRFRALLNFGTLIRTHDRAFDEKWLDREGQLKESILGSPDVSSLADIGKGFEEIDSMRLLPFDRKALMVLIAAALIPMIPLVGIELPPQEILKTLSEFLL
jgi:hypothetical protein